MPHPRRFSAAAFLFALVIVAGGLFLGAVRTAAQSSRAPASEPQTPGIPGAAAKPDADADHSPKHGGLFFLSTDYHHQLEGKLVGPGSFYLWLYDEHSQPLAIGQLKQAKGIVQWGLEDNDPKTPIKIAKGGQHLEAVSPGPLNLPITLTLSIEFPGNPPSRKPELFTFPAVRFSSGVETNERPAAATSSPDHSGSDHTSAAPGDKSADTLERHPAH